MNDDGIASTLTGPLAGPHERTAARNARAWRAIDDALTHFHIGQEAANALLPVDWWYVARRMRDALDGALDETRAERDAAAWAPHLAAHDELYPDEAEDLADAHGHDGDRLDAEAVQEPAE